MLCDEDEDTYRRGYAGETDAPFQVPAPVLVLVLVVRAEVLVLAKG